LSFVRRKSSVNVTSSQKATIGKGRPGGIREKKLGFDLWPDNGKRDMPKKLQRASLSLLALAISSCVGQRANIAVQAKKSLVGMTKEEVLVCMGAPPQRANAGVTEVWSYPSGGDNFSFGFAGTSYSMRRYCVVNIVIIGERVSAVNYNGRTGSLGEQCAFAVKNCVR
jgi:hypothetical protein